MSARVLPPEQLGHWGVVRVQYDVRAGHAAPAGFVSADLRQPHPERSHEPLQTLRATGDHQQLPAEDLQRVAGPLRVERGETCFY